MAQAAVQHRGARRLGKQATAGTRKGARLDENYLRLAFAGQIPASSVAHRIKQPLSTVSQVLRGSAVPRYTLVRALAKAAGLPTSAVWSMAEASVAQRFAAERAMEAEHAPPAEGGAP